MPQCVASKQSRPWGSIVGWYPGARLGSPVNDHEPPDRVAPSLPSGPPITTAWQVVLEKHTIEFLSGVRAGQTLGSPIAMMIANRDWKNWVEIMDPAPREGDPDPRKRAVTRVRPGHADLTGILKYDRDDARDILERASARETTARVAAAAICRKFLAEFGVRIGSHLVHLGGIDAVRPDTMPEDLNAASDQSPLRTLDADAEQRMVKYIDEIKRAGNTLGGICEVVVDGLPVGLGSHVSWDRKLDGRIGAAILSIPSRFPATTTQLASVSVLSP